MTKGQSVHAAQADSASASEDSSDESVMISEDEDSGQQQACLVVCSCSQGRSIACGILSLLSATYACWLHLRPTAAE